MFGRDPARDLLAMHWYIDRRFESQPDVFIVARHYRYDDVVSNQDALAVFPATYKHS